MSIVLKDDAMVLKVGFMVSNTHPIQLGDSRTLRVAFVFYAAVGSWLYSTRHVTEYIEP